LEGTGDQREKNLVQREKNPYVRDVIIREGSFLRVDVSNVFGRRRGKKPKI